MADLLSGTSPEVKAIVEQTLSSLLTPSVVEPRGKDFNEGGYFLVNGVEVDGNGEPKTAPQRSEDEIKAEIAALQLQLKPKDVTPPPVTK